MKPISLFLCILVAVTAPALAQQWEVGFGAGYGVSTSADVTNAAGSVSAKFANGPLFAVYGGQNWARVSGEMHYSFKMSDLKLEGQGAKAQMSGEVHSAHFDFLFHPRERAVQPFVALGAGIRYYRGTGTEHASQPLSEFALLTRANEVKPLITPAVGIKAKIGKHALVRLEFRDYITPFPEKVIAPYSGDGSSWTITDPAPPQIGPTGRTGASVKGWLHDFAPTASLAFTF